ncbi:MAG TPA: hypothetical protein VEA41_03625 [Salinarimonas sp.]|nr:hypothetical protein [Salinarimonas sp.]
MVDDFLKRLVRGAKAASGVVGSDLVAASDQVFDGEGRRLPVVAFKRKRGEEGLFFELAMDGPGGLFPVRMTPLEFDAWLESLARLRDASASMTGAGPALSRPPAQE